MNQTGGREVELTFKLLSLCYVSQSFKSQQSFTDVLVCLCEGGAFGKRILTLLHVPRTRPYHARRPCTELPRESWGKKILCEIERCSGGGGGRCRCVETLGAREGEGVRLWRSATLRRPHLNVRLLPQGRGRPSLPMGCKRHDAYHYHTRTCNSVSLLRLLFFSFFLYPFSHRIKPNFAECDVTV